MSALSELLAATQDWLNEEVGVEVTFGGKPYKVRTEEVSGALAGQQAVPRETLGVDIASTAPRVFVFSALDFKPNTSVYPPTNGDVIIFNGWNYRVTHPDVEDMSTDTLLIKIYALRKIGPL